MEWYIARIALDRLARTGEMGEGGILQRGGVCEGHLEGLSTDLEVKWIAETASRLPNGVSRPWGLTQGPDLTG